MDVTEEYTLQFTSLQLVLYNQFQREKQEKDQTFFKFMLAPQKFLIRSISKDLLWKE